MLEVLNKESNKDNKYKPQWKQAIVDHVSTCLESWDKDRQRQITWIDEIESLLDMVDVLSKNPDGKIVMKDVAIRRIYRTMVARLYNSTFKTPAQMFTVNRYGDESGENNHFEYMQKQAILNVVKRAKTKKECLDGIRNLIKCGEIILFVNWKTEYKPVRRKEGLLFDLFGQKIDLRKWAIKQQLMYDGVEVTSINPKDIVWDVKRNNFEEGLKIIRRWRTYEEIASNQEYRNYLSAEDLQIIKERSDKKLNSSTNNANDKYDMSKAYNDKMIEVLECYGEVSFSISDTAKFFPNMKTVVIGRTAVGCFMENPGIINPIIKFSVENDPANGRGIPQIAGLIPISIAIKDVLNKYHTALGLSINKHSFLPIGTKAALESAGALDSEGRVKIRENGITFYNDSLGDMQKIMFLEMRDGLQFAIQGMEYYKGEQEEETQVFKYSSGDAPQSPRTLGEVKLTQQNQNIIESCDNDLFSDCVCLRLIETVAEFMANFKDGEESIKYKDNQGKEYTATIDDTIRQGNYIYTIDDSASSIEKKMGISEYIDVLLTKIAPYQAQTGQGLLSVPELLLDLGSAYEQDDPTRIILQQPQQMGEMNATPDGMPIDVPPEPGQGLEAPTEEIL
jgi:hypothetical protein